MSSSCTVLEYRVGMTATSDTQSHAVSLAQHFFLNPSSLEAIHYPIDQPSEANLSGDASISFNNPFANQWTMMDHEEAAQYLSPAELTNVLYMGNKTAYSVAAAAATPVDSNLLVIDSDITKYFIGGHGNQLGYCWNLGGALYKHIPSASSTSTTMTGSDRTTNTMNPFVSLIRKLIVKGIHDIIFKGDSVTIQSYYAAIFALLRFDKTARLAYGRRNVVSSMGTRNTSLEVLIDGQYEFIHFSRWPCWSYGRGDTNCHQNYTLSHRSLLIYNIGHHYRYSQSISHVYISDIKLFLQELAAYHDQGHIVMYRETNAQHFPFSPIGLYTLNQHYRDLNRTACVPIIDDPEVLSKANWHNILARKAIEELKLEGKVLWIPFWESTVSRYDQHLDPGLYWNPQLGRVDHKDMRERRDCTHLCAQNPMLWMPLWSAINRNLDNAAGLWVTT